MLKNKAVRLASVAAVTVILASVALSASTTLAARGGGGGGGGGKPGGGGASTITLNQSDPHLGDTVTFTTTGSGSRIQLACYGAPLEVIYAEDKAVGSAFQLGGTSSIWLSRGGTATCYAYLIGRDMNKIYAVTTFDAQGAR